MKRWISILLMFAPLFFAGLLYVVFHMTDPAKIGPVGVLGVFFLLYLMSLSLMFVLLRFGIFWITKFLSIRRSGIKLPRRLSVRKAYYVASVIAFAPVTLLAMHAFSRIQWTDILLVVSLVAIATFYVLKRC